MSTVALSERLRQAYLALPLSTATKRHLVNVIYRAAGPVFRGTVHYESWRLAHSAVETNPRPVEHLSVEQLEAQTSFDPLASSPQVSIIVHAKQGYPAALRCLHRIATHRPEASIEVILVDDGCSDPAMARLAKVPGLRVETLGTPAGYARCYNRAADLARGQYLHFLSDEVIVHDGWLDSLLRVFDIRADCALVGSKLLLPNGRLQAAGGVIWRDGSAWHFGHGDEPGRSEYSYLRETDYCSGVAIVIPTALFKRVGRFTVSDVCKSGEDVDLAFKVRAGGARVYFQPSSWVTQSEQKFAEVDDGGNKHLERSHALRATWGDVLDAEHRPYDSGVRQARERLKVRRTILVLDHYVPKPDRDTGSRSVWDIMVTLLADGWNVKFWPHTLWYEPGYTEQLQAIGVEVVYGAEHANRFARLLQELGSSLAAVLVNRPLVAKEYLSQIRQYSRAKVLYYGIDIHHLRLREQARVLGVRSSHEERLMARLEPRIWKLSDVVFYPSDTEVAEVRKHDPAIDVRLLPMLAFDRFAKPRTAVHRDRARLLLVAGFGHPPNRDGALWLMRDVLPMLRARGVAFELNVVGSNVPDELRPFLYPDIRILGSISDFELDQLYQTSDLALVPLRYGAGVKGKVVEALRWGLPLVTTPTGAQGLPGLERIVPVCENTVQFAEQIERVLNNPADIETISRRLIEFARARFSRDAMRRSLSDALRADRATMTTPHKVPSTQATGLRVGA